ncbi:MAG: hypothetical protein U1G08_18060 [Verrucomicrobiota bacterium]
MNTSESQTQVLTPRQKALAALHTPLPVFIHDDSPDYGAILEEFHKASVELGREDIGSASRKKIESGKRLQAAAETISEGASGYLPNSAKEPVYIMPPERGMDAFVWAFICVVWAIVSALFVTLVAFHCITNAAGFAWLNLSTALTFLALHHFRTRDAQYADSLHREIIKLHERISAECGKRTCRDVNATPYPAPSAVPTTSADAKNTTDQSTPLGATCSDRMAPHSDSIVPGGLAGEGHTENAVVEHGATPSPESSNAGQQSNSESIHQLGLRLPRPAGDLRPRGVEYPLELAIQPTSQCCPQAASKLASGEGADQGNLVNPQ